MIKRFFIVVGLILLAPFIFLNFILSMLSILLTFLLSPIIYIITGKYIGDIVNVLFDRGFWILAKYAELTGIDL